MKRTVTSVVSLVALLGVALAPPARAEVTAWMPYGLDLYQMDLENGSVVPVLEMSEFVLASGVTWSTEGELLALNLPQSSSDHWPLVAIDHVTGQVSERAAFDLGDELPTGLAEDACGRLFVATRDENALVTIRRLDPATGNAPVVATPPLGPFGPLAARGTSLYMIGSTLAPPASRFVLQIDPDTGSMVEIPAESLLLYVTPLGLDFDHQGRLWLTSRPVPTSPPSPFAPVQRIDLLTGTVTAFPDQPEVAPFAITRPGGACGAAAPAIPALSPLGVAGLAAGLAAAGGLLLARRRRA
jgi:sugar lactone lactonase YvrE